MHISVLGPQWFPMIVNSLEELNMTVTFDPQGCGFAALIGGTTNTLHLIFDCSSSPDQYISRIIQACILITSVLLLRGILLQT